MAASQVDGATFFRMILLGTWRVQLAMVKQHGVPLTIRVMLSILDDKAACLPRRSPEDGDGRTYLEQNIRDEEREQSDIIVVASHLQILRHTLDPRIS